MQPYNKLKLKLYYDKINIVCILLYNYDVIISFKENEVLLKTNCLTGKKNIKDKSFSSVKPFLAPAWFKRMQ